MTSRHIEMAIPVQTIKDLLAAHLYAVSIANDNEDIELEFKTKYLKEGKDMLPLTMKFRSEV